MRSVQQQHSDFYLPPQQQKKRWSVLWMWGSNTWTIHAPLPLPALIGVFCLDSGSIHPHVRFRSTLVNLLPQRTTTSGAICRGCSISHINKILKTFRTRERCHWLINYYRQAARRRCLCPFLPRHHPLFFRGRAEAPQPSISLCPLALSRSSLQSLSHLLGPNEGPSILED